MAKNTIKLKNYDDVVEEFLSTAAAITPGDLVEMTSGGLIQRHSSAGKDALPAMFATEDELQGNGIDTDYANSSRVQVWIAQRGDQVNAWLLDGENVAIGDPLTSGGAGTLKKHVANSGVDVSNAIVGVALEAVNLAGGATANARIKVRVI